MMREMLAMGKYRSCSRPSASAGDAAAVALGKADRDEDIYIRVPKRHAKGIIRSVSHAWWLF